MSKEKDICSFCKKTEKEVEALIVTENGNICSDCVALGSKLAAEAGGRAIIHFNKNPEKVKVDKSAETVKRFTQMPCFFCLRKYEELKVLMSAPLANICDECLAQARDAFSDGK
jgi:ClpX C4-type zinc finger